MQPMPYRHKERHNRVSVLSAFIGTLPAKGNHEAACMKLFRKLNKKKICIKNIGILRCEAEITAREMQIANLDLLIIARCGVAESPKNTCCKL